MTNSTQANSPRSDFSSSGEGRLQTATFGSSLSISTKISTLWIVVMFNMVFADILSFMSPVFLAQVATGVVDGVTITPWFLLVAAVLIEIGIAMIFLSRILKPTVSRNVNLVAVAVTILFVVGGGSLTPHYVFFASIEVVSMLYIARLALKLPFEKAA